jgi:23S rRNA pseudouridine1911/1915/1917 synthase
VKNATPFTEADSDREAQDADPGRPGAQTLVAGDDAEGRLDAWLAAELEPTCRAAASRR